jgi:hypothetical protein
MEHLDPRLSVGARVREFMIISAVPDATGADAGSRSTPG